MHLTQGQRGRGNGTNRQRGPVCNQVLRANRKIRLLSKADSRQDWQQSQSIFQTHTNLPEPGGPIMGLDRGIFQRDSSAKSAPSKVFDVTAGGKARSAVRGDSAG